MLLASFVPPPDPDDDDDDTPTDDEQNDTLDPPMEPLEVADRFPQHFRDPDEDE
jgi:hypothetical protein